MNLSSKFRGCLVRAAVGLVILVVNSQAETLLVPEEYPTIQDGLNAAMEGDTVLVAPGEYSVDIVFWPDRNGIALCGSGMDSTIVIGDDFHAALYVASAVEIDTTTVMSHLTIRRGGDAGVILYGSSPLIQHSRVDSAVAGAGIHGVYGAGPTIRDCVIADNAAVGLYFDHCDSILVAMNRITGTSGDLSRAVDTALRPVYPAGFIVTRQSEEGRGIYCYNTSGVIDSNTISGNLGGGIDCRNLQSETFISGNTITSNTAGKGGGIHCQGHTRVAGNTIAGNIASTSGGGGIACYRNATIIDNDILMNSATGSGGGILCGDPYGDVLVEGNRILRNFATGGGGGIQARYYTTVRECIIYQNTANYGGGIDLGLRPTVETTVIAENHALALGGGVYRPDGNGNEPVIDLCSIVRNTSVGDAGGLLVVEGAGLITHSTITENKSGADADAIYTNNSTVLIASCNFAYNGCAIYNNDPIAVPLVHNNWWGDPTGPYHQGYNEEGLGDTLSAYAWDFQPFLAEADTVAPPIPPVDLEATGLMTREDEFAVLLSWASVPLADLAGYRVYYDTDSTGFPYTEMIDVGSVTEFVVDSLDTGPTYYLAVTCYDTSGEESWYSAERVVDSAGSAVPETRNQVYGHHLRSLQPNPFSSGTQLSYYLPQETDVHLSVHDIAGRRVATLADGIQREGWHSCAWSGLGHDGKGIAPGMYFIRLVTGDRMSVRKAVCLR